MTSLWSLYLNGNRLSGAIPPELGNLTNLAGFFLGSNQLSGAIPPELVNLASLWDSIGLAFNALHTDDPNLLGFLSSDWSATQTIAPDDVSVSSIASNSVELSWTPIEYTGDTGAYHVAYGIQPGGPYPGDGGSTADKSAPGLTVSGLNTGTRHCFVVSTHTDPPHDGQQNRVLSGHSNEVCAPACPANDSDCDDIPNIEDSDQCLDDALDSWNGGYQNPGNTRLSSAREFYLMRWAILPWKTNTG